VLECLGLSFACGRTEVDGDVMAARLVRFAFKAPAGAGRLHGRQLSSPHDVEIRFPVYVGGLARAVCLGPRTSRSQTCRARRRLVRDAAIRPRTSRLANESLDEDPHAFPETTPGGECSPSGCCNQQGYGHPQVARQLTEVFTQ
jgi:hypothetical protein